MARHSTPVWVCAALALGGLGASLPTLAAAGPATGMDSVQGLDIDTHDAGNLRTLVTNWGQIGSRPGTQSLGASEPSLEWPSGSGVEYLWAAGLWIGALANVEPHVTTTAFALEMRPGPLDIDRIYGSSENAPGGRRAPSPQADDDRDGLVDEDRLNGHDDDGDGQVDEDFRAVSDQMFCGEFNDTDAAIQGHVPLGVHVEQGTFVWSDPRIDDVLGVEYRVTNQGGQRLDRIFFGMFADCDVGRRTNESASGDDRAGFWEGFVHTDLGGPPRTVKVSIGYMFDADSDGGDADGYVGLIFLGAVRPGAEHVPAARLRNFRMFSSSASFASGGDPVNDSQRLQVLDGSGPAPLPAPDPQTGLRPALLAPRADDWRMLLSAGAVDYLDPGDAVRIAFAFVLGEGFDALVENAARAVMLYENDWRTEDPVPVALRDFVASTAGGQVRLAWQLSPQALEAARQVRVQRAPAAAGPFTDRAALAPAASMAWVDGQPDPEQSAWYRVEIDLRDHSVWSSPALYVAAGTPEQTGLEPLIVRADGGIEIRYRIAAPGPMDLAVFDVRGRRLASLVRGHGVPGSYVRIWDATDPRGGLVARSVYFVRLETGGVSTTRKLVRNRG